ncbi:MAG: hypothetical protein K2X27_14505 [Candidatus Obscuribacterales bacterium]|nr:hypothetical protein [Candidatus Obscuribacterales bacterium]
MNKGKVSTDNSKYKASTELRRMSERKERKIQAPDLLSAIFQTVYELRFYFGATGKQDKKHSKYNLIAAGLLISGLISLPGYYWLLNSGTLDRLSDHSPAKNESPSTAKSPVIANSKQPPSIKEIKPESKQAATEKAAAEQASTPISALSINLKSKLDSALSRFPINQISMPDQSLVKTEKAKGENAGKAFKGENNTLSKEELSTRYPKLRKYFESPDFGKMPPSR